jgi:hypothetical protein
MSQRRFWGEVSEAARSSAVRRSFCYVKTQERAARIEVVAGLGDPIRHSILDYVARRPGLGAHESNVALRQEFLGTVWRGQVR